MDKKKMACPNCGVVDVNEMLITYHYLSNGEKIRDTTTLPKFLYYLECSQGLKAKSPQRGDIIFPIEVSCYKCQAEPSTDVGTKIKTTKYGI